MNSSSSRIRVLYVVERFPQLSETYIHAEIAALKDDYDIRVFALQPANSPAKEHYPYTQKQHPAHLREVIQEFKPNVLHTHYATLIPNLERISANNRVPYTVRAHSFDTDGYRPPDLRVSDYCLGVLSFPYTRSVLESAQIPKERILDCWPVIDFARFHDTSPNGNAILNLGASLPKKNFQDFLDLGALMRGREFNLYSIGYNTPQLIDKNREMGEPVRILPPVEHSQMPAVYKKHQWLVYTANKKLGNVGWPLALAEAMAAGTGVCMQNLRPDLKQFLGGAGFLFDSVQELPRIVSQPVPKEMRELGFKVAKRSDINVHKKLLTDLWDKCA